MHTLVGGGGLHEGFNALDYREIKHWDADELGNYPILSVLPDKFARFLYEFHDFLFTSLDLPPLPADRSNFDVHGAINTDQVWILLYQCACVYIIVIIVIIVLISSNCIYKKCIYKCIFVVHEGMMFLV